MWKLEGTVATWQSRRFQAVLDVGHPALGLTCLLFRGLALRHAHVMQMIIGTAEDTAGLQLDDCYVRGCDLIASYTHPGARSLRPVFYWSVEDEAAGGDAVRIEALVATETELLDTDPLVQVHCHVAATRCRVFSDPRSLASTPVTWTDDGVVELPRGEAGYAMTFECEASQIVYGQIAAGTDVVTTSLARDTEASLMTAAVSLFGGRLEKGVLRRTRLRGFLTTVEAVERVLSEQWQSLQLAPPPLDA